LGACLEMVFRQAEAGDYEAIVIDSGSDDPTLEIIRRYPVRLVQIKPEEFSHSRTRNLGVQLSKGSHIVFLTQDAVPTSTTWLKNLILPLKRSPDIAGAYSRQIPQNNCYPSEARDVCAGSGLTPKIKSVNFNDAGQVEYFNRHLWKFIAFSNISASYRRILLEKYPFNEELAASEDQEWSLRLIKAGYAVYYEPASCVYHSHNESWGKLYARHRLFGRSFNKFVPDRRRATFNYFLKVTAYEMFRDYIFLWGYAQGRLKKMLWFFKIPLYRAVKNFAFYQGFKHGA